MGKERTRSTRIIAIVGPSETGKTTLLRRLVAALRRRGRAAAVVKHCGHGFDFGPRDKDSNVLLRAGAAGVVLVGPRRMAVLTRPRRRPRDREAAGLLGEVDFVFVEGGRTDADLPKIEVLRRGVAATGRSSIKNRRAVVADFAVTADVPVFRPSQIREIAELVEKIGRPEGGGAKSRRGRKP